MFFEPDPNSKSDLILTAMVFFAIVFIAIYVINMELP